MLYCISDIIQAGLEAELKGLCLAAPLILENLRSFQDAFYFLRCKMELTILGQRYTVDYQKEKDNPKLEGADGICEPFSNKDYLKCNRAG